MSLSTVEVAAAEVPLQDPAVKGIEGRTPLQLVVARLRTDRVAIASIIMILLIVAMAIAAPLIAHITGHGPADANVDNGTSCGLTGTGSQQNTDPKLDPSGPQNHGGPTATIALQSGSPAIDKIPKADCPATDQRGYPRPAAGQSMCDMGSYEAGSAPPAKLTVTSAGAGTGIVRGWTTACASWPTL